MQTFSYFGSCRVPAAFGRTLGRVSAVLAVLLLSAGYSFGTVQPPPPDSDSLWIGYTQDPAFPPTQLFSGTIYEPTSPTANEPSLDYPAAISWDAWIQTPGAVQAVILTDPATEPPSTSEKPIIYTDPRTGAQIPVSDLVLSTLGPNRVVAGTPSPTPFAVSLLSDYNSDMARYVQLLEGSANSTPVTIVTETGEVQDITQPLNFGEAGLIGDPGPPTGYYQIKVQSDVESVPEPSTIALLFVGTLGLLGYAWRRRKA